MLWVPLATALHDGVNDICIKHGHAALSQAVHLKNAHEPLVKRVMCQAHSQDIGDSICNAALAVSTPPDQRTIQDAFSAALTNMA